MPIALLDACSWQSERYFSMHNLYKSLCSTTQLQFAECFRLVDCSNSLRCFGVSGGDGLLAFTGHRSSGNGSGEGETQEAARVQSPHTVIQPGSFILIVIFRRGVWFFHTDSLHSLGHWCSQFGWDAMIIIFVFISFFLFFLQDMCDIEPWGL